MFVLIGVKREESEGQLCCLFDVSPNPVVIIVLIPAHVGHAAELSVISVPLLAVSPGGLCLMTFTL